MTTPPRSHDTPEAGFSLTELMVVLVIVGILALLAIPRFMNVTADAKKTEAKLMLKQVYSLEQGYLYQNDVYASSPGLIGFEQTPLVSQGGSARYVIAVERADDRGFTATATSVVDFDKDGTFNVWEVSESGVVRERVPD
ncbi:type IV pilin protein [Rubricoccus marinus]|uniref:General secretion pathway protein GspG n=1 Tax=Rubricoccus marinus TaxID=716817 RepID=A0A259TU17_9BACT|nr:prepilin-type N-terminal cleavage/methylation domain-containing protein [Rubricoccus marinus]OZC01272.1 hypothetical protein BSZ36_17650 [Rubricoccus marinus]